MEEKTQAEFQFLSPAWIPSTPLKPISPTTRLICQRIQEKEVCKDGSSGSGLSEPGFATAESGGSCGGAGKSCTSTELATAVDAAVDTGPDRSPQPRITVNHPTTCTGEPHDSASPPSQPFFNGCIC